MSIDDDWGGSLGDEDLACQECGAITFEGCRQRRKSGVPCEWLRDQVSPIDELDAWSE